MQLARYGLVVPHARCAGQGADAAQVEAGLVWAYTRYPPTIELVQMKQRARIERRGLWADPVPVPPCEWRTATRR